MRQKKTFDILIVFPNEKHMDCEYKEEIFKMFKLLCDNIDTNGLLCIKQWDN